MSVVVPFAGTAQQAYAVIAMLGGLHTTTEDELIIADNSGTVPPAGRMRVVDADGEPTPAHSRNCGARAATREWILFLDADVVAPATLLDDFFLAPIDPAVGAVTGDLRGLTDARTLAERYGAARNFLGQRSHVNNPVRPRASSANLLVRRAAFEQIGGYTEGIRTAEDTDFTWRLQEAGWRLGFNPDAVVAHAYRRTVRELGRQWRSYAAGARWLSERYPDFKPDPGWNRGLRLILKRIGIGPGVEFRADGRTSQASANYSALERLLFFLIQCYLAVQEQIGLRMSNSVGPVSSHGRAPTPAQAPAPKSAPPQAPTAGQSPAPAAPEPPAGERR
ncbi:MAG: glycosyltransferase family 2 protein [Solirubrobacteraceae bacterium]